METAENKDLTAEASKINLTPTSLERFLDYAKDAGNWGGSPCVGGNVGGDPADKGFLTDHKKHGLLDTNEFEPRLYFINYTDLGKAFALRYGVDLSIFGD